MEQRQWQRPNDNTDDRTLDETGDHADSDSVEGDTIHSDDRDQGDPWKIWSNISKNIKI